MWKKIIDLKCRSNVKINKYEEKISKPKGIEDTENTIHILSKNLKPEITNLMFKAIVTK